MLRAEAWLWLARGAGAAIGVLLIGAIAALVIGAGNVLVLVAISILVAAGLERAQDRETMVTLEGQGGKIA